VLLILALLLVLILFGAGFALHLLWIVAVVLLVLWVVGFAIGRARELAGTSSIGGSPFVFVVALLTIRPPLGGRVASPVAEPLTVPPYAPHRFRVAISRP
jgi:hypothetical protein